jgi:ferredoxin
MLEAIYKCGTCGLKVVETQDKGAKTLEKKELWHECSDNYVVPLQCEIDKVKHEPVQKKDRK